MIPHFRYLFEGQLGCFRFLANVSRVVVNMAEQISVDICESLGICQGVAQREHMVDLS